MAGKSVAFETTLLPCDDKQSLPSEAGWVVHFVSVQSGCLQALT
jgi:hypothetical protein